MWFDSHCHLHLCEENAALDEVVGRARAAGVLDMLTVGIDVSSSRRSIDIAQRYGVRAAVGVHPNSSSGWTPATEVALREMLSSDEVAAVGESGLDFYRDYATPEEQRIAFSAHIGLAKEFDKALVIHTRDSVDDALEVLRGEGAPRRFIFHCWSGDEHQLELAVDLGAYISFAGNVSFKNAADLRDRAAAVPHDRLLVETDSPFLSPEPHRGKPNEPRHVSFVGVAVAEARRVSVHALAEQTTENAHAVFG
ncbi:MAG: TatD family hydrolase [Actinobacteria bacterium]|nr:TatD family hydrolase [Actinomycetota bacterium]